MSTVTRRDSPHILSWLQQRAIPLDHIEAGAGFADLQPLKQILQNATVVGLGESTHGTREFSLIKHRLVEFLVVEMSFRVFAIESSYAACEPINAYVLTGEGDLADVLSGQWYTPWDTEEFSAMLRWMRAYNERVPEAERVQFYGVLSTVTNAGATRCYHFFRPWRPSAWRRSVLC